MINLKTAKALALGIARIGFGKPSMAKLTSSRRRALPTKEFALPGRKYPIDTENRARNTLRGGVARAALDLADRN